LRPGGQEQHDVHQCATGQEDRALKPAPAALETLEMPTTLNMAVAKYLRAGNPARGTRDEYHTILRKWVQWGGGVPIDNLGRKEVREFLDWVSSTIAECLKAAGSTSTGGRCCVWSWTARPVNSSTKSKTPPTPRQRSPRAAQSIRRPPAAAPDRDRKWVRHKTSVCAQVRDLLSVKQLK
jgi:hypothetical protein